MKTKLKKVMGNGEVKRSADQRRVEHEPRLQSLHRRKKEVWIEGTSPLIVHAWSEKAIKMIEDKQQKKGKVARAARDPQEEFESSRYLNDAGDDCFPASGVKKAMVSAATAIDDKINFPKTKIRQGVFVEGDLIPIISDPPKMRKDMVRIGQGSADVRYRAQYDEWKMKLTIVYNAGIFTFDQIVNLLNLAGFGVGLGEWRPERDGSFGQFEVCSKDEE